MCLYFIFPSKRDLNLHFPLKEAVRTRHKIQLLAFPVPASFPLDSGRGGVWARDHGHLVIGQSERGVACSNTIIGAIETPCILECVLLSATPESCLRFRRGSSAALGQSAHTSLHLQSPAVGGQKYAEAVTQDKSRAERDPE